MIAITESNTKNLPTSAAPAGPKTYDKRDRAIAAAVKTIGPHARNGFEFDVVKCDGRWLWKSTDGTREMSAAQIKAEGGKKALLAKPAGNAVDVAESARLRSQTMEKLANDLSGTSAEAIAKTMAKTAKLDLTENKNGIPAFLARASETEEVKAARVEKLKKTVGPDRKIKNPPNVSRTTTPAKSGKSGGKRQTKTALVGQLLLRKEGCTTADILAATGWPAVSVPAQAKSVGLGLRKEKVGKVTRYYGIPAK